MRAGNAFYTNRQIGAGLQNVAQVLAGDPYKKAAAAYQATKAREADLKIRGRQALGDALERARADGPNWFNDARNIHAVAAKHGLDPEDLSVMLRSYVSNTGGGTDVTYRSVVGSGKIPNREQSVTFEDQKDRRRQVDQLSRDKSRISAGATIRAAQIRADAQNKREVIGYRDQGDGKYTVILGDRSEVKDVLLPKKFRADIEAPPKDRKYILRSDGNTIRRVPNPNYVPPEAKEGKSAVKDGKPPNTVEVNKSDLDVAASALMDRTGLTVDEIREKYPATWKAFLDQATIRFQNERIGGKENAGYKNPKLAAEMIADELGINSAEDMRRLERSEKTVGQAPGFARDAVRSGGGPITGGDRTREMVRKVEEERRSARAGDALTGPPKPGRDATSDERAAGSGGAAKPPPADRAVKDGELENKAREAVAQGADKAAVRKRLIERHGYTEEEAKRAVP